MPARYLCRNCAVVSQRAVRSPPTTAAAPSPSLAGRVGPLCRSGSLVMPLAPVPLLPRSASPRPEPRAAHPASRRSARLARHTKRRRTRTGHSERPSEASHRDRLSAHHWTARSGEFRDVLGPSSSPDPARPPGMHRIVRVDAASPTRRTLRSGHRAARGRADR